jgi:hypothetical protein
MQLLAIGSIAILPITFDQLKCLTLNYKIRASYYSLTLTPFLAFTFFVLSTFISLYSQGIAATAHLVVHNVDIFHLH